MNNKFSILVKNQKENQEYFVLNVLWNATLKKKIQIDLCIQMSFLIEPKNIILKMINFEKDYGQLMKSKILNLIDKQMLQFEGQIKDYFVKIKEDQLNFIRDNLNKSYENVNNNNQIGNQLKTAYTLIVNLQIIKNDIESTSQKCIEYLAIVNQYWGPIDIKDFPQIHQQISEGKKVEYQLLYSSARDGLNSQVYWAKCNMQQNLLTIMTSKNGNKFGGYSHCQIQMNKTNGAYILDPTMKSFIFQYNKKEIYKQKNKEHAVFCHQSHGPSYGGGNDIDIDADFQNGYSSLGYTYDISSYNVVDKYTHIFGDKTPQLSECKVYKVIFH